ncbi:hypothetical protein BJV82DRAFT_95341 [Fennellomyces sp. T-0311]|nr:hypothetical protein BJV82DRAFT_95341 [Fennellomyces sp. T-0311]
MLLHTTFPNQHDLIPIREHCSLTMMEILFETSSTWFRKIPVPFRSSHTQQCSQALRFYLQELSKNRSREDLCSCSELSLSKCSRTREFSLCRGSLSSTPAGIGRSSKLPLSCRYQRMFCLREIKKRVSSKGSSFTPLLVCGDVPGVMGTFSRYCLQPVALCLCNA